jgi:hypothetical protein
LWDASRSGDVTLYAIDPPYHTPEAMTNTFYRSRNVVVSPVERVEQLRAAARQGTALVYYQGIEPPRLVTGVGTCTPILRTFPVWVGRVSDFTHLLDVHLATLCSLAAKPGRLAAKPEIQTRTAAAVAARR